VAKYGSPSGKKLQDDGVTPDVLVASGMDEGASVDQEAGPQTAARCYDEEARHPGGRAVDQGAGDPEGQASLVGIALRLLLRCLRLHDSGDIGKVCKRPTANLFWMKCSCEM